jgi:hypothetical protein
MSFIDRSSNSRRTVMPVYAGPNEVTRHLKINASKPLTDEQWEAYCNLMDQEIISESQLFRKGEFNLWSTTLVKKYLRPFSLGPGHPVSPLGFVRTYARAKNRYRKGDLDKAWMTVPAHIREERESILRGY